MDTTIALCLFSWNTTSSSEQEINPKINYHSQIVRQTQYFSSNLWRTDGILPTVHVVLPKHRSMVIPPFICVL